VVVDLYQELAKQQHKHDARRFAERSDLFDVTTDFARTAFQHTTTIVLTRDLRDAYCAARAQWFSSHAEIVEHLRTAAERVRWFGRAHRNETIFIKYEDLLAAPDQVLPEVWRSLGLDPANRRLNEDRIGLAKAREAAGVQRWKTELDRAETARIVQELGDYLHLFGYATDVDAEPGPPDATLPDATLPDPEPPEAAASDAAQSGADSLTPDHNRSPTGP
jgi:hypothetical protein